MSATATRFSPIVRRGLVPIIGGYAFAWHRANFMGDAFAYVTPDVVRLSPRIACRLDHDATRVLGDTVDRSFRVWKDDRGLAVELILRDNALGKNTLDRIESTMICGTLFPGKWYIRGWSVGFRDFRRTGSRYSSLRVHEVSLVSEPAWKNLLTLDWRQS